MSINSTQQRPQPGLAVSRPAAALKVRPLQVMTFGGLWSSDRRLGVRRIPTLLLESTVALLIGIAALLAHSFAVPRPAGVVFVGLIAAYTLGRQLLFPLRDRPRAWRRILVLALCAGVVAADVAVAVVAG